MGTACSLANIKRNNTKMYQDFFLEKACQKLKVQQKEIFSENV